MRQHTRTFQVEALLNHVVKLACVIIIMFKVRATFLISQALKASAWLWACFPVSESHRYQLRSCDYGVTVVQAHQKDHYGTCICTPVTSRGLTFVLNMSCMWFVPHSAAVTAATTHCEQCRLIIGRSDVNALLVHITVGNKVPCLPW